MTKTIARLTACVAGALLVMTLGVVSFASMSTADDKIAADGADPTSIMAVTVHGGLGLTAETVENVPTCAQCHTYDSLVEAGAGKLVDFDSGTVANPHFNHQYLGCTDCHAPVEQSVLYCNSCHEFQLPEGWANPTMDAAELAYEFDVSGLDLPAYADAGRSTMPIDPIELNGVAQLEANPALIQEVMMSFMASALGVEGFQAMMAAGM